VKLLFDQNLSHRLVRTLSNIYPDSEHVRNVELGRAPDTEVWAFARREGFVIVSKDADFHHRSLLMGAPPRVIWLRLGNCSTRVVERILMDVARAPLLSRSIPTRQLRRLASGSLPGHLWDYAGAMAGPKKAENRPANSGPQFSVMALVNEPHRLLADEPTGNPDSATGASVISLLGELRREGLTVVVVTHNEALSARAARRLHLEDGKLKTDSEPATA
jgi:predicted nuclease of predicted toxin-antitoxin system